MKKLTISLLFLQLYLLIYPIAAGAQTMWDPPRSPIQSHQLVYLAVRDEYQLRYAIGGLPSSTYQVRVNFWSTTSVYYSTVFESPTGVAYLTCNGTYIFEVLNTSGVTISETMKVVTYKINNPTCSSYENSGLKKENFNGYFDSDSKTLYIDSKDNNFDYYKVYKDGLWSMSFAANENDLIDIDFSLHGDGAYTVTGHYGMINDDDGNVPVQGYIDFLIGGHDENLNDDHNNGGGDPTDPEDNDDCVTLICQCIAELKNAIGDKLDQVAANVSTLKPVLDDIKGNLDQQLLDNDEIINELKDVNTELDNLNQHLTPAVTPEIDQYPELDIENFMPDIDVERQTDDTVYFTDSGEAADPGPLPPIRDPDFNWSDGENTVSPSDPLEHDDPLTVDEPLEVDQALTPWEALTPDEALIPDTDIEYRLRWKSEERWIE